MLNRDDMILRVYNISDRLINIDDTERQRMLSLVSTNRKDKVARKKVGSDASLVAGYLLETEIKKYLDIPTDDQGVNLQFEENEHGKPYLVGEYEDRLHFNMSHSGDYVIIAISESKVGVDIEECGKCNEKIAKRFFTSDEIEAINSYSGDEYTLDELYTLYWTMKEAYLKWRGDGISYGLNHFTVDLENASVVGEVDAGYSYGITEDHKYIYSVYA